MKEFFASFFKTTEERIKNPFIGAFMTSWILFNWKPIVFLIFSSKNIEDKIVFIQCSFSNIWFILWSPLFSAIFYVLILPYLNLLFDELLKFSLLKRNNMMIQKKKQVIENEKQLAIEEIKLEEAKTEFRERNTHNKLVEDLQKKIKAHEDQIEKEKQRSNSLLENLKGEINKREEINSSEIKNFERRYSELRKEIMDLTNQIHEKDQKIQKLTLKQNENVNIKRRYRLLFENGQEFIEDIDGEDITYYDNAGLFADQDAVKKLIGRYKYQRKRVL